MSAKYSERDKQRSVTMKTGLTSEEARVSIPADWSIDNKSTPDFFTEADCDGLLHIYSMDKLSHGVTNTKAISLANASSAAYARLSAREKWRTAQSEKLIELLKECQPQKGGEENE